MERNWGLNTGMQLGNIIIGLAGYYSFGLHGVLHDTNAQTQHMRTRLATEYYLALYVLNGLIEVFQNECEGGCQK